jgi:hypothetical protein
MTSTLTQPRFGSDLAPNGVSGILGIRPGPEAWPYDAPLMQDCSSVIVPFESTYDGIAQWLPPPLEPIEDLPPTVTLLWMTTLRHNGRDGRVFNYTVLAFHTFARYKDVRARALLVEYIDAADGDITVAGEKLVAGGLYLGMPKKIGRIRQQVIGDQTEVSCDRHGQRLITLRFRRGDELQEPPFREDSLVDGNSLAVREIPAPDYRSYSERSVIQLKWDSQSPKRAWTAEATLELGHLELDPLDLLGPKGYGTAHMKIHDIPQERFTNCTVLERLE